MARNLPVDLLRTLVAFAEAGSLAGAGEAIGRSTSAVSLHLKQLQTLLACDLVEKSGRSLKLTAAGSLLLAHALRILDENDRAIEALGRAGRMGTARLGLVQDLAGPKLTAIISALMREAPETELRVRVANSTDLIQAIGGNGLDVAVVAWTPGTPPPLREEPMVWLGKAGLAERPILPLVLVSRPCPFWSAAETVLHAAERHHAVVMETPSLDGARAAMAAGMGIGCRTRLAVGPNIPVLDEGLGLPALPAIAYTALTRRRPGSGAGLLGEIVRTTLARGD